MPSSHQIASKVRVYMTGNPNASGITHATPEDSIGGPRSGRVVPSHSFAVLEEERAADVVVTHIAFGQRFFVMHPQRMPIIELHTTDTTISGTMYYRDGTVDHSEGLDLGQADFVPGGSAVLSAATASDGGQPNPIIAIELYRDSERVTETPTDGRMRIQLRMRANGIVGMSDIAEGDTSAQGYRYRAAIIRNENDVPVTVRVGVGLVSTISIADGAANNNDGFITGITTPIPNVETVDALGPKAGWLIRDVGDDDSEIVHFDKRVNGSDDTIRVVERGVFGSGTEEWISNQPGEVAYCYPVMVSQIITLFEGTMARLADETQEPLGTINWSRAASASVTLAPFESRGFWIRREDVSHARPFAAYPVMVTVVVDDTHFYSVQESFAVEGEPSYRAWLSDSPDETLPLDDPVAEAPTLPLTFPANAGDDNHVLVRAVSRYGLESMNTTARLLTIDTGGVLTSTLDLPTIEVFSTNLPSMLIQARHESADIIRVYWTLDGTDPDPLATDANMVEAPFMREPWAIDNLMRADVDVGNGIYQGAQIRYRFMVIETDTGRTSELSDTFEYEFTAIAEENVAAAVAHVGAHAAFVQRGAINIETLGDAVILSVPGETVLWFQNTVVFRCRRSTEDIGTVFIPDEWMIITDGEPANYGAADNGDPVETNGDIMWLNAGGFRYVQVDTHDMTIRAFNVDWTDVPFFTRQPATRTPVFEATGLDVSSVQIMSNASGLSAPAVQVSDGLLSSKLQIVRGL